MERLTKTVNGVVVYVGPGSKENIGSIPVEMSIDQIRAVMSNLAAYEDTDLTPIQCSNIKGVIEMSPSENDEMRQKLCYLRAVLENEEVTTENMTAQKRCSRVDILNAAMKCICGDREQDYGSPESSFRVIADLWEPFLREKCVSLGATVTIRAEDVAALMCLFKLARIATGHGKADNWIDLCGYGANGGELESGGEMSSVKKSKNLEK